MSMNSFLNEPDISRVLDDSIALAKRPLSEGPRILYVTPKVWERLMQFNLILTDSPWPLCFGTLIRKKESKPPRTAEDGNTLCPKIGATQWSCSGDECTCHLTDKAKLRQRERSCRRKLYPDMGAA
jgi:hypothetical protein